MAFHYLRSALLGFSLVCFGGTSEAYVLTQCNEGPATWSVNLEEPGPEFRSNSLIAPAVAPINESFNIWNRNPTAMIFNPFLQIGTPGDPLGINTVVDFNNGHNEMWLMNDDEFFGEAAALAMVWVSGCNIVEADIVFNDTVVWIDADTKFDTLGYGLSGMRDVESAAVHELGHAAGFGHVATIYNTMGLTWRHHATNGEDALQYVGSDVTDGLISAYQVGGIFADDLSVVHWRYQGTSGQYSEHEFTEIFDENGLPLEVVDSDEIEPRYIAAAGQVVQLQFTYENNGRIDRNNQVVGFYYSPDDLITTLDQRFAQTSVNFVRGAPQTTTVFVTLPADLPQEDGYLGVIIDEDDAFFEASEQNNATYLPVRVDGVVNGSDGEEMEGYLYAAKFVCGTQPDSDGLRLTEGRYATTVNIFNPNLDRVKFEKVLALAFPPVEQTQGTRVPLGTDTLESHFALKTDCEDIRDNGFGGTFPADYIEGFVVVTSPEPLDVTAVYSSRGLPTEAESEADDGEDHGRPQDCCSDCCCQRSCGGRNSDSSASASASASGGHSIDVEQVRERRVQLPPPDMRKLPDLTPIPTIAPPIPINPASAFCRVEDGNLIITILNQGVAPAVPSTARVDWTTIGQSVERPTPALGTNVGVDDRANIPVPIPTACPLEQGFPTSCSFTIVADAAVPEDVIESDESNNSADGFCFLPPG